MQSVFSNDTHIHSCINAFAVNTDVVSMNDYVLPPFTRLCVFVAFLAATLSTIVMLHMVETCSRSVRGPVSRRARTARNKRDITPVSADSSQPWLRYQSGQKELLHPAVSVAQNVKIMLMTEPKKYGFFPQQTTEVDRDSPLQQAVHHKATARVCGPVPGAAVGTLGSSNLTCLYYVNANKRNFNDIDAFW
jgi:hypothetical protein